MTTVNIQEVIDKYKERIGSFRTHFMYFCGGGWNNDAATDFIQLVFGINGEAEFDDAIQEKVTVVSFDTWTCTDTEVGLFVYVDSDNPEFVYGVSWQACRKCDVFFYWASDEAIDKAAELVKKYATTPDHITKAKNDLVSEFQI